MTAGVVRFRSALRESVASDSGADVLLAVAGAGAACVLAGVWPLAARGLVWVGVVVTGIFLARVALLTFDEYAGSRTGGRTVRHARPAVAGRILEAAVRLSALLLAAQAVGYIR
ncbi:MAG: hypothetical protein ABSB58_12035 [Gemmatimonadales bacterium]|jgi:hypothetical protein